MDRAPNPRFQPSEGTYLYVLGVVIIATQPGRFWLGIAIAFLPIVIGVAVRTIPSGESGHRVAPATLKSRLGVKMGRRSRNPVELENGCENNGGCGAGTRTPTT